MRQTSYQGIMDKNLRPTELLWEVNTLPRPRYLLLVHDSVCNVWFYSITLCFTVSSEWWPAFFMIIRFFASQSQTRCSRGAAEDSLQRRHMSIMPQITGNVPVYWNGLVRPSTLWFPCISRQTSQGIDLCIRYDTAWLTFGHAPLNSSWFLCLVNKFPHMYRRSGNRIALKFGGWTDYGTPQIST